ncbi:MAG TPA: hypothetical protein VFA03_15155 [Acetobacteraceae bacterium]|nr:hypothetical protein [Acetobacteraceae bacterium]
MSEARRRLMVERQDCNDGPVDGAPRMMAGTTVGNNLVGISLAVLFGGALADRRCRGLSFDIRLVTGNDNVRYPDLIVDCGAFPRESRDPSAPLARICEGLDVTPETAQA